MADNRENEPIAPRKKSSLFNKAVFSKPSESARGVDMFSRAQDLFPLQLEEERRRKERKAARIERKRSTQSAELKETTPPENKRRRRSGLNEDREGYSSEGSVQGQTSPHGRRRESSHTSPGSRVSRPSSSQQKTSDSPTNLSARYERDLSEQKPIRSKPPKPHISLDDSDEEDEFARKSTIPVRKAPAQPIISLDDDDDFAVIDRKHVPSPPAQNNNQPFDEEFPELVAAAKERERQKNALRLAAQSSRLQNDASSSGAHNIFGDDFGGPVIDADPTVEILITSEMKGTIPLVVKRKLSQRLKEAKFGWCDKQFGNDLETGDGFREKIFLTWKDHRLFDSTTCRTLAFKLNPDGTVAHDADGMDSEGRIHLRAWTDSAYDIYKKRKADKAKRSQAEADGEDIVEEQKPKVRKIKLILKAKDLEPFKLVVKDHTTVQKIMDAFCNNRSVPDGKDVVLSFDGDELEPNTVVGETDIEDMDVIEVRFH